MTRTASKMVVTLSGNTQISTSQYKFGSSSIRLDGTGDYITVTDNGNFDFGTNDFTIEWWQRLDSLDRFAIDFRNLDLVKFHVAHKCSKCCERLSP